jgi:hypothetical protein
MPQVKIDARIKTLLLSQRFRPAIVTWNRLEGRPRSEDFERSLKAEVRDPLWMLCRQWQFGEFQGEDAGSAMTTKVQVRTAPLNQYAAGGEDPTAYDASLPLETRVEREPIPFDLLTRAQMGRHWLKLIRPFGNNLPARYLERFGFVDPETELAAAQLRSDRQAWQTFTALKGRTVDGGRLMEAMRAKPDQHVAWLTTAIPNNTLHTRLAKAAQDFQAWFTRVYSQPETAADSAWADSYLEYQFACAAPAHAEGEQRTVLKAEQYHGGRLDWYSLDLASSDALQDMGGASIPQSIATDEAPLTFIPSPVEFPGMPNVRWWEFEDRKVDFGSIQPSTTDLATLILAEFGLVYANDWHVIPYRLRVGVLSEIMGMVVTDVFGVRTLVHPAVSSLDGERNQWGMFHLTPQNSEALDSRLFMPPVLGKSQESDPIESVVLARDEILNMVWGVEQTLPSLVHGGIDGYEAATAFKRLLTQQHPPPEVPRIETDAAIEYHLGSQVSENWIPFIPVHIPGSNREIRLQRAAMPRLLPGVPVPVEPRGVILRHGLEEDPAQPYFVHEEEVPRAGIIVTRAFQRARSSNGKIYTWLGRRKQTGRGQGSSGLAFDQVVSK